LSPAAKTFYDKELWEVKLFYSVCQIHQAEPHLTPFLPKQPVDMAGQGGRVRTGRNQWEASSDSPPTSLKETFTFIQIEKEIFSFRDNHRKLN